MTVKSWTRKTKNALQIVSQVRKNPTHHVHCVTIPTGGTAVNKLPTKKYYKVRQFATNQLTGWRQLPLVGKLPEQETKEGDTPDEDVLESQQQEQQTEFRGHSHNNRMMQELMGKT